MTHCDWCIWKWKRRAADYQLKEKLRKIGAVTVALAVAIIGLG